MSKFRCECDKHTFSDTVLPNSQYFSMFKSEIVWGTPEKIAEDFMPHEIEIWECPECKGLTRFDREAYRTCYYKRIDDKPVTKSPTPKPQDNKSISND